MVVLPLHKESPIVQEVLTAYIQKTVPGRVRVNFAQNEGHEKPRKTTKKPRKRPKHCFSRPKRATKKPRKSHKKATECQIFQKAWSQLVSSRAAQRALAAPLYFWFVLALLCICGLSFGPLLLLHLRQLLRDLSLSSVFASSCVSCTCNLCHLAEGGTVWFGRQLVESTRRECQTWQNNQAIGRRGASMICANRIHLIFNSRVSNCNFSCVTEIQRLLLIS